MRCSKVESKLTDYIDDLVTPRQREAIDRHLLRCGACREALEDVRAATGVLQALATVRAPASFAPRVNSTVRELAPKALAPTLLGGRVRYAFGMASFALAVVVLVAWQSSRTSPYAPYSRVPAATAVASAPTPDVAEEPMSAVAEEPEPGVARVAAAPAPDRSRRATRPSPARPARRPARETTSTASAGIEPDPPATESVVATVALSEDDPRLWDRWETPATYQIDGRHIPAARPDAAVAPDVRMVRTTAPETPAAEGAAADPEPATINPFLTDALRLDGLEV